MRLALHRAHLIARKVQGTIALCFVCHASLLLSARMHWKLFAAAVVAVWSL